jgi:hypothetical protein
VVRRNSFEIDPESHPLAPAIIAFNRNNGWYRAVLGRPERGDWIGLAELSSDRADIDRRLSQLEAAWGGHAGYAATSLIQQVSHPLVSLMSWCVVFGTDIPALGPESVWLRQHPQGLFDRLAISGERLLPQESSTENDDEAIAIGVGATIVDSLSPLVGAIREVRKVGLAGLWHGVRDLVARSLLMAGSALGSVETGMSAAEAILTRAPLVIRATPRWHRDQATGMWFSLRSVCCLAYTGIGGLYCDTCPLLDDDEIVRRLASNVAGAS